MVFGLLATGAALWLAGRGQLLELAVRVIGWFAGPVLAIFLLALPARRLRPGSVLAGTVVGFVTVTTASSGGSWWPFGPVGIWATALGLGTTLAAALLTELISRSALGARGRRD